MVAHCLSCGEEDKFLWGAISLADEGGAVTGILIVEDNLESSYLLSALLSGNGYSVEVAANGREALTLARANLPDLVISDILMPVMDGFTLCRQWMQDPELRAIPFVFYSATYTEPQDATFGLNLGACRYITKPTEPDEFLRIILDVLNEYEHQALPAATVLLDEEPVYLKVYNERLVRRLELKMLEADEANRRLHTLVQVSTKLSRIQPERDLLQHALETIISTMGYTCAHYFVFEPANQQLSYSFGVGKIREDSASIRQSMAVQVGEKRGLVGLVAQNAAPLIVDDVTQEPHWIVADPAIRSAMLIPVLYADLLYGVCSFVSEKSSAFSAEDLQNATILTNTLAIAIENARLYQQQAEWSAHLEELVAQRTEELGIALEKAQSAERLKSQFITDINHELRTPLTSIGLYLDMLPRVNEPRRGEIVRVMKREMTILGGMIEDILDLSRFDLGHVELQIEKVHLEQLVELLVLDREPLAESKGLDLVFAPSADISPVCGDQKLIYQLLTNLVVNAINYTESGTVTIACKDVEDDGAHWSTISVADSGPGISAAEMEHLFERFFRGDAARTYGTPGTGLGLAICQEIVERHEGRLIVESQLGQGSTFTVWLPAAPTPS